MSDSKILCLTCKKHIEMDDDPSVCPHCGAPVECSKEELQRILASEAEVLSKRGDL